MLYYNLRIFTSATKGTNNQVLSGYHFHQLNILLHHLQSLCECVFILEENHVAESFNEPSNLTYPSVVIASYMRRTIS